MFPFAFPAHCGLLAPRLSQNLYPHLQINASTAAAVWRFPFAFHDVKKLLPCQNDVFGIS
jgi:hypothetical protein